MQGNAHVHAVTTVILPQAARDVCIRTKPGALILQVTSSRCMQDLSRQLWPMHIVICKISLLAQAQFLSTLALHPHLRLGDQASCEGTLLSALARGGLRKYRSLPGAHRRVGAGGRRQCLAQPRRIWRRRPHAWPMLVLF